MAEKEATPSSQSHHHQPAPNNTSAVCIVEDWLKSVDLVQYTQAFLDNGYDDLEVCKQIGEDDLEAIGVQEEHREKLTRAVKILKEEGGTAVYFTLEECDTTYQSDNDTEVGDNPEDEQSSVTGAHVGNKFATVGHPNSNPKVFSAQYRGNSVDNSSRRLATFSRMQLQLILRDKLALGNIDLSNPPYTNMDQTLCGSSVTALALRFSQDLNTHFAHVMDQLEELWYLANNAQNNGVYPSPSRSMYGRSQSVTYEPINYPGGSFRMHPPPLPSCPPPSTMSSSHHLPSRCGNMPPHPGHLRMDPMNQPTYVAMDGDVHGNIIEEKKKGGGSVFGRFLRNFGLRRSARKAAYKQHQGDLNASEMSMGEEDRMALMLLVKEGKISTQDALAVVQKYEEGRKQSVASIGGLEGLGKENDTPSKKSGMGKKKKGSKPPKSQSSFSADDPNSQGPPYNISSPQSPCEHMVCRRVHSLSQLDSGSNGGGSGNGGAPLPPHHHPPPLPHHHPSSPGLDGNAAQADFLARDKLMLTRAVSCTPALTPVQKLSSQGGDPSTMSRLQSPHHPQQQQHHPYPHNPAVSPPGHHYPHPHHPGLFQHAQHTHPQQQQQLLYQPNHNHNHHHHQYQQQQQQQHNQHHHHHRHLNKVEAIRERLTGKNVNGVSKTSSKTSLLSSGSDQSMDYGSAQLPLRTDLLNNRRGTTGDMANTYHSNSTVSMSSDNSPAPGRKKSTGLAPDPRLKGNHRSASCSTGDDGISSENDDPEQRSRSRQQKAEDSKDGRANSQDNNKKAHYVKEAQIYRPPLVRQTSAPSGPTPLGDRFLGQAMAVVDFAPGPEDDGFVPLKRGDVVNILNMAQSGVWRGVVNGRPGKFRFEHVEVVIEPNNMHQHLPPSHHQKGGGVLSPTPTPTPVPGQLDIPRSVSDLLTKIGLESLTNLFVMNGYDDLDIFADLDDSDLDALHVQDMDHRKRLLSAAKVLTDWNDKQSRSQTPSIKAVDSPSSRAGNSSCDSGCYTGGTCGDGGNHQHRHHKGKKQTEKAGKDSKGKKGTAGSKNPCNSCGKPTKNNPNPTSGTPSSLVPHHPYYTPGLYYGHSPSGGSGLSYYNPNGHNQLFSSSLYHPGLYSRNPNQPTSSSGSSMTTSATLTEMSMNITESSFVPPTHPHEGYDGSNQQQHPYRDPRFNNLPSIGDRISLSEEDQEIIAITYGTHRRRKPSSASAQAGIISSSSSHHSQFDLSSSAAGDLINHYIPSNSSTSSSIYHQNYDPYAYSSICGDPNCTQCVTYSSCTQCAAAYHHYVNTTIRSDSKSSKMSYSSGCTQTTCLSPDQDENNGSGSGVIGGSMAANLATSPNRLNYQPYSSGSLSHYQPYYHHHQHYPNSHPPHPPPPMSPPTTACNDCIPRPSTATSNKFSSSSSDQVVSPGSASSHQGNHIQQKPGVKSPSLSLLTLQENNSNTNTGPDSIPPQQQNNSHVAALQSATVTESTTDSPADATQPPVSAAPLAQNASTAVNANSQPWPNQSSRQESAGIANLYNTRGRNPSPSIKADAGVNTPIKSPLRSLMPLVTTKLSAERIELSVEPYTSQKGECVIPPLLVQRYSEELRQDLRTIAQVMEKIREKELKDKEMAYVKNDNLSESCSSAVELQISSVKDFMFSIGLPMYNPALTEAKVVTVEQLIQIKVPDLEKMTGADSRHLQRISHALEWVQAKLNSPTHRAKTKGPVDKV